MAMHPALEYIMIDLNKVMILSLCQGLIQGFQ